METKRYSETLRKVAPIIAEMKHGEDMLRCLARTERDNGIDAEFDVAEALYWIGVDFHSGQFSPEYRLLCATEFHPGRIANGPESGSLAELLYNELSEFVSN
jgi:hypothetical protein